MTRAYRCLLLAILSFLAALPSSAQVQTGTPPFGSFGGGPDVINLSSLNAHYTMPILQKSGRVTPFFYNLTQDTSVWNAAVSGGTGSWLPIQNWGLLAQTAVTTGETHAGFSSHVCQTFIPLNNRWVVTGQVDTYFSWTYTDSWGITHAFNVSTQAGWGNCNGTQVQIQDVNVTAPDGSGYTLTTHGGQFGPGAQIITRTGAISNPPFNSMLGTGTFTDNNGNIISVDGSGHFTDTLGTTALTVAGGAPNPVTFSYTTPTGSSASATVSYVTYTVKTNFGCSGVTEYGPTSTSLVDRVTLPDGSFYQFAYEATPGFPGDVTGRLASITLPAGGTISYQYTGGSNGIICADGSAAGLTRTTPDGVWTYARSIGSGAASTTTITDPQNNQTVIQFQGIYETQRQVFQGSSSSTLLRNWTTCYNGNTTNCNSTAIVLPITQRTVTDQYGSSGLQCKHDLFFNAFGLLTEQDDYDYGPTAPGPLLKKTSISYASPVGTGQNVFLQTVTVQDGTGTTKFRQDITYDQSANNNTPCITGAPQHNDSGFSCSNNARGNPTSVTTYTDPVTPAGPITTTLTYDSLGNQRTTTDPLSHTTTLNYTDAWSSTTCTPPSGTNAYVTSVSNALSQVTSAKYDPCTGMLASITDPNSQTTSLTYDSSWRPTQTSFPDGGQTTASYNTTSLPATVTSTTKMNGTQNIVGTTVFDGLGRGKQDQLNSDPLGVTYVDTTFDSLGRVATVSNPHRSASLPTDGVTTYKYDALGRITQVIPADGTPTANNSPTAYTGNCAETWDEAGRSRKSCMDSLGRLTTVVEDPNSGSGGANWETDYQYDALGNLLCVHQRGTDTTADKSCTDAAVPASWRPRTFAYDALSRLTNATNPESGTITYGYDAASNLQTKTAPAPNQTGSATVATTYSYDALNRLTQKSYNDGTTPTAYFAYDGGSGWGVSLTNTVGRLQQTWTGTPSCVRQAGAIFSYDAMGRATLNNQATPLSVSLTSNWTTQDGQFLLCGGSVAAVSGGTDLRAAAYWKGTFGADQFAQLTMTSFPANSDGIGPAVRVGSSGINYYAFYLTLPNNFYLFKVVNGTLTVLAQGTRTNSVGDVVRLEVSGTTLTGKVNGGVVATATDASLTSGNPGIQACPCNHPADESASNWSGGSSSPAVNVSDAFAGWAQPPFQLNYSYDLAGNMVTYSDGEGVNFTQSFDAAGRLTNLTSDYVNATHPATLATVDSSLGYSPGGAIRKLTLGNGLTETSAYNPRMQPCRMNVNSSGSSLTNCTDAVPGGNVLDLNYGFNSGTSNNGNVVLMAATGTQAFNRSYTYDWFNRLATMNQSSGNAASCSSTYGLSWAYDVWGNRTDQNVTSGTCNASHVSVDTQNRLSGAPYQYDAAGNLTNDGNHTYTYDAENRLVNVDNGGTAAYAYDALGRRVENVTSAGKIDFLYDLAGNVVSEQFINVGGYTGFGAGHVYFNGQLVAEYRDSTYFIHRDHLGSTRLMSRMDQSLKDNLDYLPFGEQISGASVTTHKFTSDERDSETNLDHTLFRQYSSSLARWTSPDPFAGHVDNPQSLNRYTYVLNDPLDLVDPLGLCGSAVSVQIGPIHYAPSFDYSDCLEGGGASWGIVLPCAGFLNASGTGNCSQAPPPPNTTCSGSTRTTSIVSANATTNIPTIVLGAAIGGATGSIPGTIIGAAIGSLFGVGGNVSYVPSTKSWYAGPTLVFAPAVGGGNGLSVNAVLVPPDQNPNSIANGLSYSATFQPVPLLGSTVVKSPGSGPAVVGPSVGTRVPVSFGVSYNFRVKKGGC